MTATISDPFEQVDDLEQIRRELIALDALAPPAASRNEFDDIADEAQRVSEAATRASTEVQHAAETAIRQHTLLGEQSLGMLQNQLDSRHYALANELGQRAQVASFEAESERLGDREKQQRRRTRVALWAGPALITVAGCIATLIASGGDGLGGITLTVVCAAVWGGAAELLYRYFRNKGTASMAETATGAVGAATATTRDGYHVWMVDRPGVAAACSAAALVITPIVVSGACLIVPIAVIAVAIYFFKD